MPAKPWPMYVVMVALVSKFFRKLSADDDVVYVTNAYEMGKSEATSDQPVVVTVNRSVSASPEVGDTVNAPPVGGPFTVTTYEVDAC